MTEHERLTYWPLRAKITVAVLVMVLVLIVAVGTARQELDEVATGPLPVSTTPSSTPPSSATTATSPPLDSVPPPSTAPPPTATSNEGVHAFLAQLQVVDAAFSSPGYSRDLFPTWLDLDGNGCDAREDTLIVESLVTVEMDLHDGCDVVAGRWLSIYDGVEVSEPSDLDVDHLVPLAEAWRSGAHGWEPARRAAFANDLTFADHLIAVTASTNRSKSDSPPNEWRPPRHESWCRYAGAWVTVKRTWTLSVTAHERDALGQMLETC